MNGSSKPAISLVITKGNFDGGYKSSFKRGEDVSEGNSVNRDRKCHENYVKVPFDLRSKIKGSSTKEVIFPPENTRNSSDERGESSRKNFISGHEKIDDTSFKTKTKDSEGQEIVLGDSLNYQGGLANQEEVERSNTENLKVLIILKQKRELEKRLSIMKNN